MLRPVEVFATIECQARETSEKVLKSLMSWREREKGREEGSREKIAACGNHRITTIWKLAENMESKAVDNADDFHSK